jgi:hypothetical protein
VFKRPDETDDEAIDRLLNIFHARYTAPWRDYCRPVNWWFNIRTLRHEATVVYDDGGHVTTLNWDFDGRWHHEGLMTAARQARCRACEKST